MSKSIKKALSLLLALTMVLSLGLPAYAVGVPEDEISVAEEPAVKPANLPIGAGKQPGVIEEDETISDDLIVDIVDAEGVVEEDAAPARTFTYSEAASGFAIEVSAPAGALPLGTEMVVDRLIDLAAVQAAVDAAENLEGEVQLAADISFWHEGKEIEPAAGSKLLVRMSAPEIEGIADPIVIHLPDGENAVPEIVEQMSADDDLVLVNAVEFEAEDFSVYAVIGEVIIEDEEGTIDFESEGYTVTVSYTKEAQIPFGTKLIVSEIPYGSDEYFAYREAALEKLNENANDNASELESSNRRAIADAIFVDVSLEYNGKPFEPAVPLDVKITLKEGALYCPAGEDALVVHFGDKGTELIEDVAVGLSAYEVPDGMPEGVLLNSFDYEQNGFSVVGLVTTDVYINFEAAQPASAVPTAEQLLASIVRAAGDPTIDAGKTVTDNNGDGIYELALSVKATSQQSTTANVTKSNVVMVIDVSGSMGNDDSYIYYETYTYDSSTYDQFRYYSSSSSTNTRLYYGTYRTGGRNSTAYTGWYSGGYEDRGRIVYATAYSGTVYAYETRLHATQRAACAVVDALLAYNVNDDNITDVFEITVVKFAERTASGNYNGTETVIKDSTSATEIKNAINGLTAGGGTHWRAALEQALSEANYFKNTDPSRSTDPDNPENTSVIFLTDGFPTEYGTGNDGGAENNSNVSRSFWEARNPARSIVQGGFTLYNIFAFGNDTTTYGQSSGTYNTGSHTGFQFLRGLANYAYGSGTSNNFNETDITRQHCFNAKSTDDLVAAFNTIINHITNQVGYAGVNLSDGVSLGATSTSVAVNGTAKPESMRYTVKDEAGKIAYTVKINSSGEATFTIYNADGTTKTLTDSSPETKTTTIGSTTITSQVYSVKDGDGDDAPTYEMAPATIDADTGMVTWNLAGLGILKSGYTYTVAFDVWPNQKAYDICADLNNGIFENIDAALDHYGITDETERQQIKDALVHNADGSYSLYTNYSQNVEYYPATSETDDEGNVTWTYGEKQNQEIPQPDPIPLKGSLLPLAKVWESNLAISEYNELLWENGVVGGTSKQYKITLHVWKADTRAEIEAIMADQTGKTPYITQELGWDEQQSKYIWEKDVAVAPGMMLNVDAAKDLGYDTTDTSKIKVFNSIEYYVIEEGHYFYVTEEGGDLHFYLDEPLYHPMIVDGTLYNVFFGSGQTVDRMDPMYAVEATNYLKGGLNINKTILDFENKEVADVEDEFAFKITLWNDESGTAEPVYTFDDQIDTTGEPKTRSGSIGYRILTNFREEDGQTKYDTIGRGAILPESSQYKDLANGIYCTFENGKTVITLAMPAKGEIRIVNLPNHTKYTVEEIVDTSADAVYEYVKTENGVKYTKKNAETQAEEEVTEITGTVTNNVASGTVTGNKASLAKFYNQTDAFFYVYHSADNTIEKISFTDNRVKGTFDAETNKYTYTFNIANETKDGFIYGGYYQDYADKGTFELSGEGALSFEQTEDAVATTYDGDHEDGYWAEVTEGDPAPYLGDASKWSRSKACTVNGMAMGPEVDAVYFLREVPDVYMRGALRYTYYNNADKNIGTVWLATAIDDEAGDGKSYKDFGLLIGFDFEKLTSESSAAGSTAASLRIETRTDSNVFKTYTAGDMLKPINSDFANAKGFVGYIMIRDKSIHGNGSMLDSLVENNQKTALYWVTPDDVQVTGVRVSSVDHIGGTASTIKLSKFGKYEAAEKDITSTLIYVGE